jgi:hypothetical protein
LALAASPGGVWRTRGAGPGAARARVGRTGRARGSGARVARAGRLPPRHASCFSS